MTVAIERLAMSPFHNGQNKDSRSYTDWETHLLRRDWDEFYAMWLDDSRYGGAGGSNSQPAGGVA